jgi:hypothetical protein
MMNLDATVGRPPLVLLVDPVVATRHCMWRALNRVFGVLEAGSATAARAWIDHRPDIDALVVQDELPDQPGLELVHGLARERHPIAARSIVLARPNPKFGGFVQANWTLLELGDMRGVLSKLAGWFFPRDAGAAKTLLREADRLAGGSEIE